MPYVKPEATKRPIGPQNYIDTTSAENVERTGAILPTTSHYDGNKFQASYSGMDISVYAAISPQKLINELNAYKNIAIQNIQAEANALKRAELEGTLQNKQELLEAQVEYEKLLTEDNFLTDINYLTKSNPTVLTSELNKAKDKEINSLIYDITVIEGQLNDIPYASQAYPKATTEDSFQKLMELQTFSYSIYRDTEPVKVLGQDTVRGFTRGYTTIAGTMIFTVIHEAVLANLFTHIYQGRSFSGHRIDQLPPIDIFVVFANEYGNMAKMSLFGVQFMNEGQVHSVQDLITENSVNYQARHFSRMKKITSIVPSSDDDLDSSTIASVNNTIALVQDSYAQAYKEITTLKKYFQ